MERLCVQNMLETMKLVCELLSADGDGSIPLELFYEIYEYLAKIDGTISAKTIQAVRDYLDPFAYVNLFFCTFVRYYYITGIAVAIVCKR